MSNLTHMSPWDLILYAKINSFFAFIHISPRRNGAMMNTCSDSLWSYIHNAWLGSSPAFLLALFMHMWAILLTSCNHLYGFNYFVNNFFIRGGRMQKDTEISISFSQQWHNRQFYIIWLYNFNRIFIWLLTCD